MITTPLENPSKDILVFSESKKTCWKILQEGIKKNKKMLHILFELFPEAELITVFT